MAAELVFKDEAAAEYDRAFAHVTAHFMPFLLRGAHVAPGMHVLDIATGTGLSAEAPIGGGNVMSVPLGVIVAAVTVGLIGTSIAALAQQAPPTKVQQPLQADLAGLPDQETLVQVVDFPANGGTPWHTHPDGHEIAYVIEGIWIAEADGNETKTLKAGDSVYVPPNAVHRAYNDASGPTKIIVVRIKPKGKPITTPFTR